MGGGSQQPSGQTTTVQKSDPWSGQQPYLTQGFQSAQNLYNSGGPQYYPGTTYSPSTPAQNTALTNQIGQAQSDPLSGSALNFTNNTLNGAGLNANPGSAYLQPYANGSMLSAQNPYFQNMAASTLAATEPGLANQFTGGNRMNSPGAAYGVSQGLGSAIGNLAYQNYNQGQALQQNAATTIGQNYNTAATQQVQTLGLAPQSQQMPYADTSALYNAGAQQQQLGQNTINDQMAKYNYQQSQPYNLLDWYNSNIGGSYGSANTLTSPYFSQPGTSPWLGAAGGALSGAGMGASFGPYGAAAGAVIGGLYGGLSNSDRRLKEKIKRIGTAENSLPIYSFHYKGDPIPHIGFMADEVEKLHPEAVSEDANGFKLVDYELARK